MNLKMPNKSQSQAWDEVVRNSAYLRAKFDFPVGRLKEMVSLDAAFLIKEWRAEGKI